MRHVLVLLIGLLPACRPKNVALRLLLPGSWFARTARVQPVVLWRVHALRMGEDAYIGPGNVLREIRLVDMAEGADIGQFNWFSAAARFLAPDAERAGCLVLRANSAITSRHYIDCSGGLDLGASVIVGGVRSTILTHSIDPMSFTQQVRPVIVGHSSLLASGITVTPGVTIAENVVVGSGAVVVRSLDTPCRLYIGAPAVAHRDVSSAAFVDRTTGRHFSRAEVRERLATARLVPVDPPSAPPAPDSTPTPDPDAGPLAAVRN